MYNYLGEGKGLYELLKEAIDEDRSNNDVKFDETYVVKLRDGRICCVLNDATGKLSLYDMEYLTSNEANNGIAGIEYYKGTTDVGILRGYDIVAYKKNPTQQIAIYYIVAGITPLWDWEEKEVDWANVEVGTPILIKDREYSDWCDAEFITFFDNQIVAKIISNNRIYGWKYAKLK